MAWTFRTARADVTVRVRRLDAGPSEVRRVRVVGTVAGQSVAMSLALDAPNRLRQTVEGADAEPRTLTVPPLTPAEVVGRQLSDRERDAAFRDSLATAQVMARSLVG
jgi:hypothetical protein